MQALPALSLFPLFYPFAALFTLFCYRFALGVEATFAPARTVHHTILCPAQAKK
ncbi:hypothetical protein GTPT_0153 [Tatumella ptyseos ATCC 33301]|uniref:Uncharacterized protein n=1 Tax=Tatumella ptyseos ATCC 33301 TaxID=1005995 RepID=A0A085JQ30_9GAMM|nr:hypothetical protein GTPT_0153 [Tatumella ptyseos ATCC 33301]